MKILKSRIFLYIIVALYCTTVAKAQLVADKKTQSVGDVRLYSENSVTFTLKNQNATPLNITKIVTSNSLVKATAEALSLAPNATTTLRVESSTPLAGRFTHAIYIYTDQSEQPLKLNVKGRGFLTPDDMKYSADSRNKSEAFAVDFGDLAFSTDNIEFDYVNVGDVVSKTIYVTNNGNNNCEPNLLLLPKYLSVKASPKVLRPGRRGYLVVTLDSRKLDQRIGLTQNVVYASSFAGEKAAKENAIPVSIVLFDTTSVIHSDNAPSLELSTTQLLLPPLKRSKVKGEVTITNNGKSNLQIKSLQTFHPAINVSLPKTTIMPGETIKLKVAMVRKYIDKSNAGHRILMITNDYKNPVVLITVDNQ